MVNKAKKPAQWERVLNHLQKRGSLTALQAHQMYGIARLDKCVYSLKKKGYMIDRNYVERINSYQESIQVAQYKLHIP